MSVRFRTCLVGRRALACLCAATFVIGCKSEPTREAAALTPATSVEPSAKAGEAGAAAPGLERTLTSRAEGSGALTLADRETVLFVREQEKLARDVYAALSQTWRLDVFNTMIGSEEIHSDTLRTLLARHKLSDPSLRLAPGEFTQSDLKLLHDRLIARGKLSPLEALKACASIEEMEITGIGERLALAQAEDIQRTLEIIVQSDRHHLRSLVDAMRKLGHEYVPSRLSRDELSTILRASS
jgi:hypothetical protein